MKMKKKKKKKIKKNMYKTQKQKICFMIQLS